MKFKRYFPFFFVLLISIQILFAQTNPSHVRVSGYYRSNGTYVQPYFRTAPNSTNRDNFSTRGNVNPYTGKPGWIEPDNNYNTLYYNTYSYNPTKIKSNYAPVLSLPIKYKNRTYVEDENGKYSCYLTIKDERTFNIYDMNDNLILYLVINHRKDWRIFDNNWIYIKTIFVTSEK
ncbi:MAG: hypothetical protein L3J41_16830 [Melioribacteraceae bacterium]|nr:hypothetical protein [Melioribacteraceae bacterium]